jgi:hypothetical protein
MQYLGINISVEQGVLKMKAKFNVAVSFLTFGYFLSLTRDDNMGTFYWTLDYEHSSDFGD